MTGTEAIKLDLNGNRVKNKRQSGTMTKEQEVPLSNGSLEPLDDSSSSMPSSPPSAVSSVIDDVIPPAAINGSSVGFKLGKKTVTTQVSHSSNPRQASYLLKARTAMASLLPLFDKMPQEVMFGDEILQSARSPSFTAYCELEDRKGPMYMQPSVVMIKLDEFNNRDPSSSLPSSSAAKANFKRPRSPHTSETGRKTVESAKKPEITPVPSSLSLALASESSGDLKGRLQAKLAEFKVKRKAILDPADAAVFYDTRRKLIKLKKKEKSRNKKAIKKQGDAGTSIGGNTAETNANHAPSVSRSSSVVSEEGKMIFSRFDFFDAEGEKAAHPKQMTGKNLTYLLNKAEADQRKLSHLQEKDEKKAKAISEKKTWSEALLKAQGVKLKNDPTKLKQALKEQTKRKEKSGKKWQERKQHIQQEQKQRQEKRQTNIKARQTNKKDKKRKKGIKKGHIIPGFN